MRRFRVFLFVLLAIAVPLQGYAHALLESTSCCPMEQMDGMDGANANTLHDCCDDADHPVKKTGQDCTSGHACQFSSGVHFTVSVFEGLPQIMTLATRYPHLAEFMFSFDSAATWRPPAPF
jgi:hypothetical protein